MNANSFDATLDDWEKVSKLSDFTGILLGNGSSLAVWEKFRYGSLYEKASANDIDDAIEHPLTEEDKNIFEQMKTKNFEEVLRSLKTAKIVTQILRNNDNELAEAIDQRYAHIRAALFEAVGQVHLPWTRVNQTPVLQSIREALLPYSFVYSTNYDLLVYWSIMGGQENFKDYMWNNDHSFNLLDTEIHGSSSIKILYLHGALHLYRGDLQETKKRVWEENGKNILQLLSDSDKVPLFISEGDYKDKLRAIHSSDYLSFAYNEFANHKGGLVVFGHSLDNQFDKHLIDAIKNSKADPIAISIYRPEQTTDAEIIEKKVYFTKELNGSKKTLEFFNAETHPLGAKNLRIEPDEPEFE